VAVRGMTARRRTGRYPRRAGLWHGVQDGGTTAHETTAATRGGTAVSGVGQHIFLNFSLRFPRVQSLLRKHSIGFSVKTLEPSLFPVEFVPKSRFLPNFLEKCFPLVFSTISLGFWP